MTPAELYKKMMGDNPSIETPLPKTFKVDAETYARVCNFIFAFKFNNVASQYDIIDHSMGYSIRVDVGKEQKGIMFKGVELILCLD